MIFVNMLTFVARRVLTTWNFKFQVSGFRFQVSKQFLVSSFGFRVLSLWFRVYGGEA